MTGSAGPQFVRLVFSDGFANGVRRWYRDSASFSSADPVLVLSGGTVSGIDFALP